MTLFDQPDRRSSDQMEAIRARLRCLSPGLALGITGITYGTYTALRQATRTWLCGYEVHKEGDRVVIVPTEA